MKYLSTLTFIFILFFSSCSLKTDIEVEKTKLLQADNDWAAAAKSGEIDKIKNFWSDDAIDFFPDAPPAKGKEAILKLVGENRSKQGFSLTWKAQNASVSKSGDLGYTYGTFQMSFMNPENQQVSKHGNYVCIWKKDTNDIWKCVVESSIFSP